MAAVRRNGHPLSRRIPLGTLVTLAVGIATGILVGLAWLLLTPPSVPTEDYAVAVAAAYARERLPLVAIERLTSAGLRDPVAMLVQVAKGFRQRHPDRPRDAANIEQLADVLKSQSKTASGASSGDGLPWALLLVIGAVLLAAAYYVSRGTRRHRRRPRSGPSLWQSMPQVRDPELEEVDLLGGVRSAPPGEQPLDVGPVEPYRSGSTALPRLKSSTIAGNGREIALRPFVCSYHAGDEPFEDVHPVLDDESNTLVGACGLTAAAKIETSVPARYYAFTAWVHDYLSGEPMRAVGLLSPWASGRKRVPLYDPTLTQATLYRTQQGLRAQMETRSLVVSVEVDDVGFGTARDVPANSYFTILAVRFDVKIKAEATL